MALVKSLLLDSGISLPEAYFKIQNVNVTLPADETKFAEIRVYIYKDAIARQELRSAILTLSYVVSGTDYFTYFDYSTLNELDVNIVSQAYLYLKGLAFYNDAIDML